LSDANEGPLHGKRPFVDADLWENLGVLRSIILSDSHMWSHDTMIIASSRPLCDTSIAKIYHIKEHKGRPRFAPGPDLI
jgi:hypothetical protein